jgi:hypothetical protein
LPAIRRFVEIAVVAALIAVAEPARADPQISVGLTAGGGAAYLRTRGPIGVFTMGLHGDVLFFRNSDRDFAFGPYVEVLTVAFETLEMGGGVSWLIPISEHIPLVLSVGAHARAYEGGWEPGVHARLWLGSRSYNFRSIYGLAAGVFVEGRWGLGDGQQADILGGAQIDLEVFALPFVLLYNAFRSPHE